MCVITLWSCAQLGTERLPYPGPLVHLCYNSILSLAVAVQAKISQKLLLKNLLESWRWLESRPFGKICLFRRFQRIKPSWHGASSWKCNNVQVVLQGKPPYVPPPSCTVFCITTVQQFKSSTNFVVSTFLIKAVSLPGFLHSHSIIWNIGIIKTDEWIYVQYKIDFVGSI